MKRRSLAKTPASASCKKRPIRKIGMGHVFLQLDGGPGLMAAAAAVAGGLIRTG